jgi:acetyltransferase-like isoleucine patch superfamily enzyme
MFNDNDRPGFFRKWYFLIRTKLHYELRFKKKFSSIASMPGVLGIWNVVVYGDNISLGRNAVITAADGYRTTLTTVKMNGHEGRISIGDNVLVMNGVRVSSACSIEIGDGSMLANFCYITDCDWHDIYDRRVPVGRAAPVVLEKGVWVGDSAIILKGVRVGENSVIGAGSVVRENIPPNSVAFGNPAKVIRGLDPSLIKNRGD